MRSNASAPAGTCEMNHVPAPGAVSAPAQAPAAAPSAAPKRADFLRFVMLGSVDHGKSTLVGRLLHDTNSLPEGKLEQIRAVSKKRGLGLELAFAVDALQSERDQLITIDAAHVWFRTPTREYAIVDAPGHEEFLRNMVTGAAMADAALLLIDAAEGVRAQSHRHAYLLKLLGIDQVAVVVNKMDLAGYSAEVFRAIESVAVRYLRELGIEPAHVIPASAREGANVCAPSPLFGWYRGPTVLEALEGFLPRAAPVEGPLRFPIQDVYKFDERRILAGRIESGTIRAGDELVFSPWNKVGFVRTIERWNGDPTPAAGAGESIGITLDSQIYVERGQIASHPGDAPIESDTFEATVFWLGSRDLRRQVEYRLKLATQEVSCRVTALRRVIDVATLEPRAGPVEVVRRGEIAEVAIRTRGPIAIDDFAALRATGRFVLYDEHAIAGGGTISTRGCVDMRPQLSGLKSANIGYTTGKVSRADRARRTGHGGRVVWFTGLSGSGKSTVSVALERALFDRGYHTYLLDGDNVRHGLSADLGFSEADRRENIRRVGEVARLMCDAGLLVIVALISPLRADRDRVRAGLRRGEFIEVFTDCPLDVCEARDPKGLYKKARAGKLPGFTGIDAPYEPPEAPEVVLPTARLSVEGCVAAVIEKIAAFEREEG